MKKKNDGLFENLTTKYPQRLEPNYAWGNAVGGILMTPKLRGFWPGSLVDETGICYDASGQGRTLFSPSLPTYAGSSLYPYADFTRASAQYLKRATEDGLEITDSLVVWTWVYFDSESTDVVTPLVSKWGNAWNHSWMLAKSDTTNELVFKITMDGNTEFRADDGGAYYEESKWLFVLGRFAPCEEVSLFVGIAETGYCDWYKNTTNIPTNIYNSTADLEVGGLNTYGLYLDGKLSLWGLANYA